MNLSDQWAVIRDQRKRKRRRSFSDRLKGKAHRAAARGAVWVMVALWALGIVGLVVVDYPGVALPCAVVAVVSFSAARRETLICREQWRRYFEEEALAAEMIRRERWERNFTRYRRERGRSGLMSRAEHRRAEGKPFPPN
jgi:hypothetical protein